MGQGHALSVLARAYHHSGGDNLYLNSALAGLNVIPIHQNMVQLHFKIPHLKFSRYILYLDFIV